jgi:hypothetical protein
MKTFALLLALILAGGPAFAQSTPPSAAEETSLQGFGAQNPTCQEWNDGCATCLRDADAVRCSVTGIACQPSAPVCVRPK